MVSALQFYYDMKYTDKLLPAESDYNGADTLFKEGNAAMIIMATGP
jgi:arabinogalactan oligomer/maltooligosaccharide transport system substrate-binding protein